MKRKTSHIICAVLTVFVLLSTQSCSPNRFLSEGDVLYRGPVIELEGPEIEINDKRLKESVSQKIQPKPNRKFLGLFYTKLWLHEKVEPKPDKERGFKHWLKYKLGEEPVLVSDVDTSVMSQVLEKLMQDNGLFHTHVTPEIVSHRRQAKINYTVTHTGLSTIGFLRLPDGDSQIDMLARDFRGYSQKEGEPYSLKNIKTDRQALAKHIRSFGYYDFYERNILYLIDTAAADKQFIVDLKIKEPENDSLHRIYHLRDVHIYPNHSSDAIFDSTTYRRLIEYKGLNIHQDYMYIGRKALSRILLLEPDTRYSMYDYDVSLNRLVNTGIFRFVDIQYEKVAPDSLDVKIYLTPTKYQGVKVDVEASTSNRSFFGTTVSLGYNNGNLFRGAEQFSLKSSVGAELQTIDDKVQLNLLNVNVEARLDVPGLITGFKTRKIRTVTMPSTYLRVVNNFQKSLQYYTINSLKMSAGYQWKSREKWNHDLEPISFEWVTLLNQTNALKELIEENPQLEQSFRSDLIFGPKYSFSVAFRRNESKRSRVFYSGSVETAGNLVYGIGRLVNKDKEEPYGIKGVAFANFSRFDNELRHYWDISEKMSLVSRIGFGLGISYGNSDVLPFVRQFFMGGPNTIRAFPFRTVGPGRYAPEEGEESNPVEQAGDLQLLMNVEYRFTLYRFLRAAIFMDAGNVWLLNKDPLRERGKFRVNQFYRQLAVGTGLGIRLDFDFFALRVDMGIPVYKPFNEEGERVIGTFPEEGFKEWRKENWTWNIAIGYPF